jgi:hypothetical protein
MPAQGCRPNRRFLDFNSFLSRLHKQPILTIVRRQQGAVLGVGSPARCVLNPDIARPKFFPGGGRRVVYRHSQCPRPDAHTTAPAQYLGELVEFGPTEKVFTTADNKQTEQYITGRFG